MANYTVKNGVFLGANPATVALFKDVQRQLNRAIRGVKKGKLVVVDGKIGKATLTAARAIGAAVPLEAGVAYLWSSPQPMADAPEQAAAMFAAVADRRKVAANAGAVTIVDAPVAVVSAGIRDGNPLYLAALGAAGIWLYKKHQRGELRLPSF